MLKRIQMAAVSSSSEDSSSECERDSRKQAILVIPGRKLQGRARHLLGDLCKLFPFSRREQKVDTKRDLHSISELCALNSCSMALLIEDRSLCTYIWIADVEGPTLRFEVVYFETFQELGCMGNFFSKTKFSVLSYLGDKAENELILRSLERAFNGKHNSAPECDKVLGLFEVNGCIWLRFFHYEASSIVETGPRIILRLDLILSDFFKGSVIFSSKPAKDQSA
jgi:hypothetical protein